MVHHDRIEPCARSKSTDTEADGEDEFSSSDGEENIPANVEPAVEPRNEDDNETERRYPQRVRTQRKLPDTIPWSAIQLK